MTYPRATALALIVGFLIAAVWITLLGCPSGAVEVEGDLFQAGRCFTVTDGVVHSNPPTLGGRQ